MKLNVEVEVDGKDVTVTGRNEVGKSTFINLIWYGLTGKEIPNEPIRLGEDAAKIEVTVKRPDGTTLICTRKFKRDGKDTLKVSTPEGATFTSPQTFLNSIIGQISFDPMDFVKLGPLDQKKWLQKTLGIDTTELETSKKIKLAELDNYKKQVAQLEKDLELMPEHKTPLEERMLSEVADKQKEIKDAERKKKEIKENIAEFEKQQNQIITRSGEISRTVQTNNALIEQLHKQISNTVELNSQLATEQQDGEVNIERLTVSIEELNKAETAMIVPDDNEIQTIVKEIHDHNQKVKQQELRREKEAELEKQQASKSKKDEELKALEDQRTQMISSVKMPVEGLDFSEEGITFEGLPFVQNQFSTAKMDDIGIDISIALNPGLKVLRIRDWALFDNERKTRVMEKAKANGFQVFREQVTEGDSIGFIMEE